MRLRMRPLQWLSGRLRRARRTVGDDLSGVVESDLFLFRSVELSERELMQHLVGVDEVLGRGELFEPPVVPGLLVWELRRDEVVGLRDDLRALRGRVRGVGHVLVQTWKSGVLVEGRYRVTAHTCLLTARGDRLLWRRRCALWIVDSRSTAGRPYRPWRSVRWVS